VNATGTIATAGATAAFTNTRNRLELAVTAGKWGAVRVEADGGEVAAAAVPDAGFAVDGDANPVSLRLLHGEHQPRLRLPAGPDRRGDPLEVLVGRRALLRAGRDPGAHGLR